MRTYCAQAANAANPALRIAHEVQAWTPEEAATKVAAAMSPTGRATLLAALGQGGYVFRASDDHGPLPGIDIWTDIPYVP